MSVDFTEGGMDSGDHRSEKGRESGFGEPCHTLPPKVPIFHANTIKNIVSIIVCNCLPCDLV